MLFRSWALGFHILSYIPITVIGAWYLTRLGLHFKDFRAPAGDAPTGGTPPSAGP